MITWILHSSIPGILPNIPISIHTKRKKRYMVPRSTSNRIKRLERQQAMHINNETLFEKHQAKIDFIKRASK